MIMEEIIQKKYEVPDGKGGFKVYHWETSSKAVFMSDGTTLEDKMFALFGNATGSQSGDTSSILDGTYIPSGSDGEGERNGIPTSSEVAAVLNNTYEHTDRELDFYAPSDVTSVDDVINILNGTYEGDV